MYPKINEKSKRHTPKWNIWSWGRSCRTCSERGKPWSL